MTIDDELDLLQRSPVFAGVPASRLRLLALGSDSMTFQPGEAIFEAGDLSDKVYLVLSGRLSASEWAFELRYIVGIVGALLHKPYVATVRAETEVRALCVPRQSLLDLATKCPHTSLALMTELARMIELLAERRSVAEVVT
jgi:CRP-like cAMP-binding protein